MACRSASGSDVSSAKRHRCGCEDCVLPRACVAGLCPTRACE
ncbi:Uncharacterised protein [Vibrio cholerae]|nr:Uncharacterised protein [Vibrio cholerae]